MVSKILSDAKPFDYVAHLQSLKDKQSSAY